MPIPSSACTSAFERHYDTDWNDPSMRNERLGWIASWNAATALHQIAEPSTVEKQIGEVMGLVGDYIDQFIPRDDSKLHEKLRTLLSSANAMPVDPMDWPLPCDVTVGHITIKKGVHLKSLVLRTQALFNAVQAASSAQSGEQAPFGYVNTSTGQFFKDVEPCRKNNEGHWRTVYERPAPALEPVHHDDAAVDALATAMKAKLAKKRAQGYGGWDTDCTQERLSELLRGHIGKGDPVDVANFCAFLLARGEGIAPAASVDKQVDEVIELMRAWRDTFILEAAECGRKDAFDALHAKLRTLLSSAQSGEQVQAVAHLDIGAGGYIDLGSDLTNEQLSALPKGRHALAICGTFGIDGFVPAAHPAPALEVERDSCPTLDDAWKARLLDGAPLERDKYGCGYHPALPTFDEGVNGVHFFAVFGIELKAGIAESQMDSEAYEAMTESAFTEDGPNYNAWTPAKPEGDGWCLVAVFDTEDGPACWWLRAASQPNGEAANG